MLRKLVAVTLFVSFVATVTAVMIMFFIEKPSFTIQTLPIYKLFGLIMVIAIICYLFFNYHSFLKYLKTKSASVFGAVVMVILVLLYGAALTNKVPKEFAESMDALTDKVDSRG